MIKIVLDVATEAYAKELAAVLNRCGGYETEISFFGGNWHVTITENR